MKNTTLAFLAVTLLASGTLADAHDRNDSGYKQDARYGQYDRDDDDDRYERDQRNGYYDQRPQQARYDYARVIRIEPISRRYADSPGRACNSPSAYHSYNTPGINGGAVIGAVIGGVLGNSVGNGDGRAVATIAGATVGGLIGNSINDNVRHDYRQNSYQQDYRDLNCSHYSGYDSGRNAAYRVTYRYNGRYYTTLTPYYPGRTVRVRVESERDYYHHLANNY